MSNPNPVNFAASAYAKLKNIAHAQNKNFMHLLTRYAIERFLYRLSVSAFGKRVIHAQRLIQICNALERVLRSI